ncbi:hypothetical protein HPL003_10085 [Paenibacillus terrae HPL-003]|uniref:Holin n=1 Tax=Paenibacillus terrae (strain HPL-003) TaxID=985665 RepID=G7VV09_PAETH|nr:hypothetical protein [Paenibacillus terrae]AET58778.1 hypothetical protein HPL003_10085 [Paenibacillus terrae HPL-003]
MTDWKRKLSSRKFWALLAALITSLLTAFGANNDTVIQVTGVIGAFGAVVAYILARLMWMENLREPTPLQTILNFSSDRNNPKRLG